jgi:hypothetical protein
MNISRILIYKGVKPTMQSIMINNEGSEELEYGNGPCG